MSELQKGHRVQTGTHISLISLTHISSTARVSLENGESVKYLYMLVYELINQKYVQSVSFEYTLSKKKCYAQLCFQF